MKALLSVTLFHTIDKNASSETNDLNETDKTWTMLNYIYIYIYIIPDQCFYKTAQCFMTEKKRVSIQSSSDLCSTFTSQFLIQM